MKKYIPYELYEDTGNMKAVSDILASVPDTDLIFGDEKTIDDAIKEIRDLGESRIADFLEGTGGG